MPSHGKLVVVLALLTHTFIVPTRRRTAIHCQSGSPLSWRRPEPLSEQALRASLGRKKGQENFYPAADLNGDSVVNALDAALFKLAQREGRLPSPASGIVQVVAGTERVIVEPVTTVAVAEQTVSVSVSVLVLVRDSTTPLVGYSLEVTATAQANAVGPNRGADGMVTVPPSRSAFAGSVPANGTLTNFFDERNLITACPPSLCSTAPTRDPVFSVIADNGSGGVTIDTVTADFSTVLTVDGVNDVLAQVLFDVPSDALGDFTIQLGSSSTLIDANAESVPFTVTAGTIRVFSPNEAPAVSVWGLVILSLLVLGSGSAALATGRRIKG